MSLCDGEKLEPRAGRGQSRLSAGDEWRETVSAAAVNGNNYAGDAMQRGRSEDEEHGMHRRPQRKCDTSTAKKKIENPQEEQHKR